MSRKPLYTAQQKKRGETRSWTNWTTWAILSIGAALASSAALGGTFGQVVVIGGEAIDLALDESRGVLYIANFTANTIEVMSLATNNIQTSINVNPQPDAVSISPDNHWLLVGHFGNTTAPASQPPGLTLIDLTNANAKTFFPLSDPVLAVAFGGDDKALVVTATAFVLFDPSVGTTQTLETIAQVAASPLPTNAVPQPPATFPLNFTQAASATSKDGLTVAGFGGSPTASMLFRYSVANHTIYATASGESPALGPRTVSVADDGSQTSYGWWTVDTNFVIMSEFNGNPGGAYTPAAGLLPLGSSMIDSSRSLIYAQIPPAGTPATVNTNAPILQILDADNLTLEDQLQLPENLAGKSVITNNHNTMYGISDSGVMVLAVGSLNAVPRLAAGVEDLVFRGNFCNRSTSTQTLTITDPGGNHTPFSIASSTSGLSVSPSSGITPAVVTVSVDPNTFASQKGTVTAALTISSTVAANLAPPVRVLINSEALSQRGNFIDVPGRIVDVQADPTRNVYYLLRQDKNQLQVWDGTANTQTATLRTCTNPSGMAITFDQQYMLVGCNNSHYMMVYDLDLLQAQAPLVNCCEHVQSIAASTNAILASTFSAADNSYGIDSIDMVNRVFTRLPALGVWQNGKNAPDTALAAASNGANILAAGSDGSVMIYSATANTFTVSRHDFASMAGSYAASSFNQYIVGTNLLDGSGVPHLALPPTSGNASGFAFVDQGAYFTAAPNSAAPGVIQQVDLANGTGIQPTSMVEAPNLSPTYAAPTNGTTTTTITSGSTTVTTITTITPTGITTTTQTCTASTAGSTTTNTCSSTSGTSAVTAPSLPNAFTRSLAPLPNRNSIISLTTSGFTVLPWSYAASVAPPQVSSVVSAADGVSAPAPGGLISIYGNGLSATNLATSEIPLPTALANSCLTVNGEPMPLIFVSPNQINAQMPAQALGDVEVNVYTPGGESDNFNLVVQPTAPAVFLSGVAGPQTNIPTVIRAQNNLLVTDSNPVHPNDTLVIYLTGCGNTNPAIPDGMPAPSNPAATAVSAPSVSLGGTSLPVMFGGMTPGQVGLCQFNVTVPNSTPQGLAVPLTITQGAGAQTLQLRVAN
jgi:uncharacterized protein (TIGR03437 family)